MTQTDYQCTVEANVSPQEAHDKIARIAEWWLKDVTGPTSDAGDRFRVRAGRTWVDFEVTDAAPGSRYAWKVTDSYLPWLEDKSEWTATTVEWDIAPAPGGCVVVMTHRGLRPGVECYNECRKGWNFYTGVSLLRFLNEGRGLPDQEPEEVESAVL